jgi:hypothetical protein
MTDPKLSKHMIYTNFSGYNRLRSTGKIQFLILFFIISTLFNLCCQQKKNSDIQEREVPTETHITKIVYHFEDASVPPQYHRSYTITVTPDSVKIVVNSYGEILADRGYKTSNDQFLEVVQSLVMNDIRRQPLGENKGCTGGTGEGLSYWDETGEIFSASVYHCGGRDSGDLAGNIKSFSEDLSTLIPELDTLLK